MTSEPGSMLLEVKGLSTWFETGFGTVKAVQDASFSLRRGKTLCVVGESGSGKSAMARSILQIVPRPGRIVGGEILLHGSGTVGAGVVDLAKLDPRGSAIRSIRGRDISMIFQEPMSSLSPVHTIGHQIMEAVRLHRRVSRAGARERAIEVLEQVRMPRPRQSLDSYPFEFSGGMRQRAMTAMALACEPKLLIADEPTTALDVTTQAEIIDLIQELQARYGMSVMFITHDMGVVAEIAEEVAVMQLGRVVERGPVDAIFHDPQHPYTRRLLASVLKLEQRSHRAPASVRVEAAAQSEQGAATADGITMRETVLRVRDLSMVFAPRARLFRKATGDPIKALDRVSFDLFRGETLGIVGESGSGKTTLGRCVLRVLDPSAGTILFQSRKAGEVDLAKLPRQALKPYWREIRMVFQDPFASLNPRMTVFQIIAEPLVNNRVARGRELEDRVAELMRKVGLSPDMLRRYPHAFSGGQRQRIGIARAIALQPQIIVADEATSALDVSLRAQMLDLLLRFREEFGLSYLFISHDISVVRYMCDRVAVMHLGKVVEIGETAQICQAPRHPYTRSLISAVPRPDPRLRGSMTRIRYRPEAVRAV